jgi:hypothetical protein
MYVRITEKADSAVSAAQALFIAGTIPLILAGGGHALLTLVDTVHATYFTPRDASVRPIVESTQIRFGGRAAPSMWKAWLGFNISHGLGVFTFGLLLLLIATQNFRLVEQIGAIQPLSIAFPAIYLVVALRFWFYGPVIITATSTACFVVAAALAT